MRKQRERCLRTAEEMKYLKVGKINHQSTQQY